ncbi:MAG: ABC transporter substrate-binding protein, partial [Dehalococcoidia bacterium]
GAKWHTSHGDWGEFDADDFIGTAEMVTKEGSIHTASGHIRRVILCDKCQLEKLDSHTIQLTRPGPSVEITWHSRQPEGSALAFHSIDHFEATGEEAAGLQSVGTGPWELIEAQSGLVRKMKAVNDHWRKTPEWEEMWWQEIAEESTRLANFETGQVDTGSFNSDSIQALKQKNLPDVRFKVFPGANSAYLNILGQIYNPEHPAHHPTADKPARVPIGEEVAYTARCQELVYVSCDRDVNSAEWQRALKVRQAMAMSIDRQKLVNNLAFGEGAPYYVYAWLGHGTRAQQFGLDKLQWEYNPEKAKQLLAEAGVGDGFEIEFALPLRPGAAGAIVAGEAVATMWEEIGIKSNLTKLPMSEYRGGFVRRTNIGVNAHNGGAPIEPLRSYSSLMNSANSLNFGFEHPDFQAPLEAAGSLTDDERWGQLAEMATFVFENVVNIPLYTENSVWPLGPNLGEWEPLNRNYQWLSNWEAAPHR